MTVRVHDERRLERTDLVIAAVLGVATVVMVGITSESVGFTRDEGYYFKAAELYFGWFRDLKEHLFRGDVLGAFSQSVIDQHWSYNHEHPVLVKSLFALSWGLLKEWLGLFDLNSSAFRFPAWCFAGLTVGLIYVLSRALRLSRVASLVAAGAFLSMPRAYWHMHLACFDIPVCAAHLWLVLAYLKGRRSTSGALILGVAFGLAIAVKHNVLIAPAFFVLHWILVEAKPLARVGDGIRLPPLPLTFFSMAVIGPVVFIAHWPYLWPDVFMRIGWYLGFHLSHEHYPILWFGDLLTRPPFPVSFPFVMSAVTIPLPVLMLLVAGAALGTAVSLRFLLRRFFGGTGEVELTRVPLGDVADEPSASPALLLLLNAAFPFALIALPSSPIFGGTKHWMNALPFLCVLGAWAIDEARARIEAALQTRKEHAPAVALVAVSVVGALVVLPGALLTARIHPFGLASYNSVVGFARGAANVGFQRTFWGYEPRGALGLINDNTRPRGSIHFGDTNYDDYRMYLRDGLLRSDIRFARGVSGADVASVQPQGEFKEQWIKVLNDWNAKGPDEVVHIEGVPLVTVTFNPKTISPQTTPREDGR